MSDSMVFTLTIVGVLVLLLGVIRLRHVSVQGLMFGITGAIIGLLLGALASVPLSKLPVPYGDTLPLVISGILTIVMIGVLVTRRQAIVTALPILAGEATPLPAPQSQSGSVSDAPAITPQLPPILVDTSAIIDGRIADIATAGFMPGRLLVPRFVLAELQNIADSDDAMRRGRGRRGLDVLNTLRELEGIEVSIIEDDAPNVREVDAKLVALAQRFGCNVLTTDYNLNRVAQIQGVRVLNVNELSNAIRPVVLPGEELIVRVVQPGKERNQGVGYLADGTMIVVENGDKLIGQEVPTEVTRVFQTVAGKMIFAVPRPGVGIPAVPLAPAEDPVTIPKSRSLENEPVKSDNPRTDQSTKSEPGAPGTSRRNRGNRGRGNRRPQSDRSAI